MSDFGAFTIASGFVLGIFIGSFIIVSELKRAREDFLEHWYRPENRNRDVNFTAPVRITIDREKP